MCCVFCFVFLRLVSCVWLCPTNIVVCFLFCLSSSCVLCMVVSNTYCGVFFILFFFVLCLVYGCVQHILWCVFCFVFLRLVSCVWLCPTHIVVCFLFCFSCVLRMVVSNTYCGVFFVLFVFVFCIVYPMLSAFLDCPFLIVPFGILCHLSIVHCCIVDL